MNKHIYPALAAITLCAVAFPAFADPGHESCRDVKITSSQIVGDGFDGFWLVSGSCLEQVTNVALANDFGKGFEELPFDHVDTDGSDSLEIPLVPRLGLGGPYGCADWAQFLSCESDTWTCRSDG